MMDGFIFKEEKIGVPIYSFEGRGQEACAKSYRLYNVDKLIDQISQKRIHSGLVDFKIIA